MATAQHNFETTVQDNINVYASVPRDPEGELYGVMGIGINFKEIAPPLAQAIARATNRNVVLLDVIGAGEADREEPDVQFGEVRVDPVTAARSEALIQAVHEDIPAEFQARGVQPGRDKGPISFLGHCAGSGIVAAAANLQDVAGPPADLILAEPMGMHPGLKDYNDMAAQFLPVRKIMRLQNKAARADLTDIERAKIEEDLAAFHEILPEHFFKINLSDLLDPTSQANKQDDGMTKTMKGRELNRALHVPVAELVRQAAKMGIRTTFLSDRFDRLARTDLIGRAIKDMQSGQQTLPVEHVRYGEEIDEASNGPPPHGHGKFTFNPEYSAHIVGQILQRS